MYHSAASTRQQSRYMRCHTRQRSRKLSASLLPYVHGTSLLRMTVLTQNVREREPYVHCAQFICTSMLKESVREPETLSEAHLRSTTDLGRWKGQRLARYMVQHRVRNAGHGSPAIDAGGARHMRECACMHILELLVTVDCHCMSLLSRREVTIPASVLV